jgi:hypothetical protein
MSGRGHTAKPSGNAENPYTRTFRRDLGSKGILNRGGGSKAEVGVLGHPVACARLQTAQQQAWVHQTHIRGSAMNVECNRLLNSDALTSLVGASLSR